MLVINEVNTHDEVMLKIRKTLALRDDVLFIIEYEVTCQQPVGKIKAECRSDVEDGDFDDIARHDNVLAMSTFTVTVLQSSVSGDLPKKKRKAGARPHVKTDSEALLSRVKESVGIVRFCCIVVVFQ
jgi:hypothetical protein